MRQASCCLEMFVPGDLQVHRQLAVKHKCIHPASHTASGAYADRYQQNLVQCIYIDLWQAHIQTNCVVKKHIKMHILQHQLVNADKLVDVDTMQHHWSCLLTL